MRLALVEGALFYPIVGAIFGGVFIMLQKNVLAAFPTWKILMEHGPALIGRMSPALAGILVAARAGASISSWCGQLAVTRQFDALTLLRPHLDRRIAGAGWAGLFVAGIMGTLSFALGLFTVFALYLWLQGHPPAIVEMLGNFEARRGFSALFKVVMFSGVVAGASMASARQPKSEVELVATDLTRGIMLSTLLVMSLELLTLIAEWLQ